MSRELIFGHAKSKFQRQFRSPIRSCLNSTRIPKTSALRAAPQWNWPILRAASRTSLSTIHITHTAYTYWWRLNSASNCRAAHVQPQQRGSRSSAHALQDINIRDDFIIGSAVCVCVCVSSRVAHIIYLKFSFQVSRHQDIMEAH
jgi:hypothetical protein